MPETFAERVSQWVEAIPNLSSQAADKFNRLYDELENEIGMPRGVSYCTYINKAANAQVRMAKQMPQTVRLALGFCGKDDWASRSYPNQSKRVLADRRDLACVLYFWRGDGDPAWQPRLGYCRPGAEEADWVRETWPDLDLVEIADMPGPVTRIRSVSRVDQTSLIIRQLQRKKNVVLEGVPGTGKSYSIDLVADAWVEETGRTLGGPPSVVVLHPSSSYEDLVEGLRPGSDLSDVADFRDYPVEEGVNHRFLPTLGRFVEFCRRAADQPEADHLLVLDELNRANVPKALGELLLVMEHTKRAVWTGSEWSPPAGGSARLTYTGIPFFVPSNVYILATMNTTDRSVAPLDAALRRRFSFIRMEPMDAAGLLADLLVEGPGDGVVEELVGLWSVFNEDVLRPLIGPDGLLGHSYFFDLATTLHATHEEDIIDAATEFLLYEFLPQLIDAVASNGREDDIFGEGRNRLDEDASEAVASLDAVLDEFGLRLKLEGVGIGRLLSVSRVQGHADRGEREPVASESDS